MHHPLAQVSGTVRSATVAAMDFPGVDIRVIDTLTVSTPLGTMVEQAASWAGQGVGADEIISRLQSMIQRCRIYFLVDTLEFLARGGRIGGATALLGSVLQIKPILTLVEGHVETFEKERTHKRGLARIKELVTQQFPKDQPGFLSIMHGGVPDQAAALGAELGAQLGQDDVPVLDMPPAIVTHGGPGVLGVGFFTAG